MKGSPRKGCKRVPHSAADTLDASMKGSPRKGCKSQWTTPVGEGLGRASMKGSPRKGCKRAPGPGTRATTRGLNEGQPPEGLQVPPAVRGLLAAVALASMKGSPRKGCKSLITFAAMASGSPQ